MPFQLMLTLDAWNRIDAAADNSHAGALELESFFIGQLVGRFNQIRTTRQVVDDIMTECRARLITAADLASPLEHEGGGAGRAAWPGRGHVGAA